MNASGTTERHEYHLGDRRDSYLSLNVESALS
jgi:hypothetical protein